MLFFVESVWSALCFEIRTCTGSRLSDNILSMKLCLFNIRIYFTLFFLTLTLSDLNWHFQISSRHILSWIHSYSVILLFIVFWMDETISQITVEVRDDDVQVCIFGIVQPTCSRSVDIDALGGFATFSNGWKIPFK